MVTIELTTTRTRVVPGRMTEVAKMREFQQQVGVQVLYPDGRVVTHYGYSVALEVLRWLDVAWPGQGEGVAS